MASEKQAALAATPSDADAPTIFDKIINKEIPSTVVYEDDKVLAFRDISPQAPTHILIIPKVKDGLTGLSKAEERHFEILGRLLYTAKLIAKQEGLDDGFRTVINDGPKGCKPISLPHSCAPPWGTPDELATRLKDVGKGFTESHGSDKIPWA
ncbi:HIT-like domain, partial [Sesbania bispinosa]